jgi:hypothetical protein
MPNLRDIELEIENILAVADELPEGEQETALEYLDQLGEMEAEKVDAIGYAIRKRQSEIVFLKEEEDRLYGRRKAMESRLERFREYLKETMQRANTRNIKGTKTTLFLMQRESVDVYHAAELPEKFVNIKIDYQPDKAKIKDAIKSGTIVPGASLTTRTTAVIR